MAERFPWPFPIPLPGRDPPGDRIYRTPEGEPLNEPGQPVDPGDLLPDLGEDEFGDPIEPDRDGVPNEGIENFPVPGEAGEPPVVFQPGPPIIYAPGPPIIFAPGPPVRQSERPNPRNPGGVSDELRRKMRPRAKPWAAPLPQALQRGRSEGASRSSLRGEARSRRTSDSPLLVRTVSSAPRSRGQTRSRGRLEQSPALKGLLAFRGPPPARPAPERTGNTPLPSVDIFEILRRSREQRERERRRREDLFRRGIPAPPTPDEMAPYPVEPWPRVRTFPSPPRPLEVPPVAIPAPRAPSAPTIPQQSPMPPALPLPQPSPRAPRAPRPRAPRARTARVPVLTRVAQLAGLSILRPILRRSRVARPELLRERTARIENPIEERLQPDTALPGLTPIQGTALGFAAQPSTVPQSRRSRQRDCECEETEEEKEEERERSRSNVVAKVKPYNRRMSQNSLDNLRRP